LPATKERSKNPRASLDKRKFSDYKQCIVVSKPPCSRCQRLKIPCVGYGERRLKFQDESQTSARRYGNPITLPSTSPSSLSKQTQATQNELNYDERIMISPNPTNALAALIASFAQTVGGEGIDTGHHLAWNFGDYLYDVPRYLGSNDSLDAAADALVPACSHFRQARYSTANAFCLRKYLRAIKSLRESLSTVEQACEPATLSAIMIIMLLEVGRSVSYDMTTCQIDS